MTEGREFKLVAFDRTSAKDMFEKLRREIQRMESPTERAFVRDHVTNAFWTAWHLHAWIWDAIREQPELKAAVMIYRGIDEDGIDDHRAFGDALARRFVPLKICRMIATSSQLIQVELLDNGSVSTAVVASDGIDESTDEDLQSLSSPAASSARYLPAIVIMGRRIAATRILREVETYWATLIHECGIEQFQ